MQNAELLAQHPSDNKQRFDQHRQIGKVLDQFLDARLEPDSSHRAHLETEVTQRATQVIRIVQILIFDPRRRFVSEVEMKIAKLI